MVTKKTTAKAGRRGVSLAVSYLMLASYLAVPAQAFGASAAEKSPTTETANPTYGNERVSAWDHSGFPMTEGGKLAYSYGEDLVKNGSFNGFVAAKDPELSEELLEGDGSYAANLKTVAEVGTDAEHAVAGAWGNRKWADGYAQIVYDGDEPVANIFNRGPGWSHIILNVAGKGVGSYTVKFDYKNTTGHTNAYCALGNIGREVWTEIREYGDHDPNLVSAPGWQNLNVGTPIEGKDGWYRYEHTYSVEDFDDLDCLRVYAYVGADMGGSFLVDNLSVTFAEEEENLIEGGGTFDGVLDRSGTLGTSADAAVNGAWTNPAWADSYGKVVDEDGNAVLKIGYTGVGVGWAHAFHNFEARGAGEYLLEFDYYNPTGEANAYVGLYSPEANVNSIGSYGNAEVNLFSAPGWQNGFEAGTEIAGRPGWRRFSKMIRTTRDDFSAVRIWAWTSSLEKNYVEIDNLSVRFNEPEDMAATDNLIALGGTFENVLAEGETEKEIGASYENPVAGAWGNHAWADSYGKIVDDGGNAVVKIGYTTAGWAHAIFNFENRGAGKYLVEFDYKNSSPDLNAYACLGRYPISDTGWLDQTYDEAAKEVNLFSGVNFSQTQAGTPIEGKEGWYHFKEYVDTTDEALKILRIYAWTNLSPENYLLVDNVSVKLLTPLSDTASYTLTENDPSGWTTSGVGVVSKVDGDYALTVTSDGEAVTSKTVNGRPGSYWLQLKCKADTDSSLSVRIGDENYTLLVAGEENGYKRLTLNFEAEKAFEKLEFISTGTVVIDGVVLQTVEVDYNVENSVKQEAKFDGDNLAVGGGTFENYLSDGETQAAVASSASEAKEGVWSNGAWADSPAIITKDGVNTYAKVGFVEGKGGFAHIIQTFDNQGAGNYLVEFDYRAFGTTDNCHVAINSDAFSAGDRSAAVIGKGTPIEGREGWYHFSATFSVANSSMKFLRLWFNTASNADNYILLDNLSVKAQTGTEIKGTGEYAVPYELPDVPAGIWSFLTDAPAVIEREDINAVVKMNGRNFSSFFYGFDFEKSGVYAFSFDFRPQGNSDNIGFRINPVEEKYTFDVPLLQYRAQWETSELGEEWYHFTYYINIDDEVAYKDASFQFWCNSQNRATLSIDNLSVRRLVSADVTGNPVWGRELIADGGFEGLLGIKDSYTVPNVLNDRHNAVTSVWTTQGDSPAAIVVDDDLYLARLSGQSGYSSVNHKLSMQNEGLYRVQIRYAVTDGYIGQPKASLTYALGETDAEDILASAAEDGNGYKVFTQYVRLTAEEAALIDSISVRFACADGYKADIDYISVKKEVGSDIPKEEVPDDDITNKKR